MKTLLLALIPLIVLWARPSEHQPCDRKFVVALNNYAPFAYRENGQLRGFAHDIVSEISQRSRCSFIENEVSRPSSIADFKGGRSDIVAFIVKSSEFEHNGTFIPIYKSTRELTVLKSAVGANKNISDYINDDKIKFAHLIGIETVISPLDDKKLMSAARLVGTPDPEGSFALLAKGRVQATMYSSFLTEYYVKKLNLEDKVVRIPDTSAPIEVGFYTSKRRMISGDDAKFAAILAEMKKDGTLLKIMTKYMGELEAKKRLATN